MAWDVLSRDVLSYIHTRYDEREREREGDRERGEKERHADRQAYTYIET